MLKTENTLTLGALAFAMLACFYAPATAQYVPRGSYQQTCTNEKLVGSTLSASCQTKKAGFGEGDNFAPAVVTLKDIFECDGDIGNNNGYLQCARNANSARMQSAKAAIDKAYKAVTGFGTPSPSHTAHLRQIFDAGLGLQFFNRSLEPLDNFFITLYSKPENFQTKATIVELAYKRVYGYATGPKEFAIYNSQKMGYSDIVKAETAKLNSNPSVRHVMINLAYKTAFGRMPTAGDRAFWLPKTENFMEIVGSARTWLYSPQGAKDLAETVRIHLSNKLRTEPTSDQIKAAIAKNSVYKYIFEEM